MPGFEDAWSAVKGHWGGEPVSQDLRPLLEKVYRVVLSAPVKLAALKKNLETLLEFLTNEGRTNANCWATDMFFMLSNRWERDWTDQNLTDDFHDVLSLIGQALHDAVRSPQIVSNFDCLPEQILSRVRHVRT